MAASSAAARIARSPWCSVLVRRAANAAEFLVFSRSGRQHSVKRVCRQTLGYSTASTEFVSSGETNSVSTNSLILYINLQVYLALVLYSVVTRLSIVHFDSIFRLSWTERTVCPPYSLILYTKLLLLL